MTDSITDTDQPVDVVTTEAETTAPELTNSSQLENPGDTEQETLILDVEDAQANASKKQTLNADTAEYRAFRKEKEAKRRKQKLIDEMLERDKIRESELQELRSVVTTLKTGPKPTLESCDFDETQYEKRLSDWYSEKRGKQTDALNKAVPEQQPSQSPRQTGNNGKYQLNEVIEYEHFNNEKQIKKHFPDYDVAADTFLTEFHDAVQEHFSRDIDLETARASLIEHGHLANVDMSKAMLALSKVPALKNRLLNPATLSNPVAVADILREAEKSVKSAKQSSIISKPVADVKQGGPVNNTAQKIQQLLERWQQTRDAKDYKAYREAKKNAS